MDPWIRDPEEGFYGSRISDPPPIRWSAWRQFFRGTKYYNSLLCGSKYLYLIKSKIIFNPVKFMAPEKDKTTNLFTPPLLLLLLDPGSEIDSKIKIRDKQPVFATLVLR